jgi:hypothetical protein
LQLRRGAAEEQRSAAEEAVARLVKDPDAEGLRRYLGGVPVGIDYRRPRARSVCERRTHWHAMLDPFETPVDEMKVFQSAKINAEVLRNGFERQRNSGMFHITTRAKAGAGFGNTLHIAALAVLREDPESWRMVQDGTHGVCRNNRVKVRDQVTMPGAWTWRRSWSTSARRSTRPASR